MAIRILYLFLILLFTSCEELEVDEGSIFENECAQNYSACEELGNECQNGNDNACDLLGNECQNGNDNACDVLGNQCALGNYYACEELGDACEWGNSYACDVLDAEEPIPGIISLDQYINGSTASFNWEGNKFAFSYSFRLESQSYEEPLGIYINWSDWSSDTLVALENLDEGQYIFQVKSRFEAVEQAEPATNNFEIDAISGPALRMYPMIQEVQQGNQFDIYLYTEKVDDLMLMSINISFDWNMLNLVNVELGGTISNYTTNFFALPVTSHTEGEINITAGFLNQSNLTDFIADGTASLVKLTFQPYYIGTTEISIFDSVLRNKDYDEINILESVGGTVVVFE